jgi:hypothetical protein
MICDTIVMPKKKKSRHGVFAEGTAGLSVRVPDDVKAKLQELAQKDSRTLSAFVAIELGKLVAR